MAQSRVPASNNAISRNCASQLAARRHWPRTFLRALGHSAAAGLFLFSVCSARSTQLINLHVVEAISVSEILGDITPQRGRKWPVRILGDGNIFDESFDSTTALARDLPEKLPENRLESDRGRMAVNDYGSGWDTRNSARAGRGRAWSLPPRIDPPPPTGIPAEQGGTGRRNVIPAPSRALLFSVTYG
jgi:hypothetical protein